MMDVKKWGFIFLVFCFLGCKMKEVIHQGTHLFVWSSSKQKAIVLIHGGKASTEATKEMGKEYAGRFYPAFTVISVDYRFSSYGGKELEDVLKAISYARDLGIQKIYLIGESHGAYLALLAAAQKEVDGVIDAYGPTDLLRMQTFATKENPQLNIDWADYIQATEKECKETGLSLEECIKRRSPYYLAAKIKAPILILHGTDDTIVPISQSEILVERFKEIGKRNYQFVPLKGYEHGFSLLEGEVFEKVRTFLNR